MFTYIQVLLSSDRENKFPVVVGDCIAGGVRRKYRCDRTSRRASKGLHKNGGWYKPRANKLTFKNSSSSSSGVSGVMSVYL